MFFAVVVLRCYMMGKWDIQEKGVLDAAVISLFKLLKHPETIAPFDVTSEGIQIICGPLAAAFGVSPLALVCNLTFSRSASSTYLPETLFESSRRFANTSRGHFRERPFIKAEITVLEHLFRAARGEYDAHEIPQRLRVDREFMRNVQLAAADEGPAGTWWDPKAELPIIEDSLIVDIQTPPPASAGNKRKEPPAVAEGTWSKRGKTDADAEEAGGPSSSQKSQGPASASGPPLASKPASTYKPVSRSAPKPSKPNPNSRSRFKPHSKATIEPAPAPWPQRGTELYSAALERLKRRGIFPLVPDQPWRIQREQDQLQAEIDANPQLKLDVNKVRRVPAEPLKMVFVDAITCQRVEHTWKTFLHQPWDRLAIKEILGAQIVKGGAAFDLSDESSVPLAADRIEGGSLPDERLGPSLTVPLTLVMDWSTFELLPIDKQRAYLANRVVILTNGPGEPVEWDLPTMNDLKPVYAWTQLQDSMVIDDPRDMGCLRVGRLADMMHAGVVFNALSIPLENEVELAGRPLPALKNSHRLNTALALYRESAAIRGLPHVPFPTGKTRWASVSNVHARSHVHIDMAPTAFTNACGEKAIFFGYPRASNATGDFGSRHALDNWNLAGGMGVDLIWEAVLLPPYACVRMPAHTPHFVVTTDSSITFGENNLVLDQLDGACRMQFHLYASGGLLSNIDGHAHAWLLVRVFVTQTHRLLLAESDEKLEIEHDARLQTPNGLHEYMVLQVYVILAPLFLQQTGDLQIQSQFNREVVFAWDLSVAFWNKCVPLKIADGRQSAHSTLESFPELVVHELKNAVLCLLCYRGTLGQMDECKKEVVRVLTAFESICPVEHRWVSKLDKLLESCPSAERFFHWEKDDFPWTLE
uniref:JmjC domain-containing protein n=1 Tax=Mycena chlorophos TaxID=658473 RepID=A0ABQ0LP85_MYCCL|nr:predicted protein [Mycena chlorophos]